MTSGIRHDYKPSPERSPADGAAVGEAGGGWTLHIATVVAAALVLIGLAWLLPGGDDESAAPTDLAMVETRLALPQSRFATTIMTPTEPVAEPALPPATVPGPVPDLPVIQETIGRGDTLDAVFRRNGIKARDLVVMMGVKDAKEHLRMLRPGDTLELQARDGDLQQLTRRIDETRSLRVERDGDRFAATWVEHPIEVRTARAGATIRTSLFEAGKAAGISDRLIMSVAGVFAWDIDFALDIRQGDRFVVVYEEIWQDGAMLRDGDILAAEFVNDGEVFRAVRFEPPDGRADYYTPEGRSVRKAFLRAPVDFRRVSSNFNPNRLHPVLKVRRPHRGVDYAAKTGTPIKAAGDGKVSFRGRKGGYGNVVIIEHGGNITTLYAHMSRFAKGVRSGTRVRQGQVIGYVGRTGYATGPHLHYEYRVNGVHRNPRTVKLPDAKPVDSRYKEQFVVATRPLLLQLDALSRTQVAQAD